MASASQIYANINATTPLDDQAKKAMFEAAEVAWGNPSASSHDAGAIAKHLIENARKQIADMIEARPEEILFTSGGTESNNMVIYSVLQSVAEKKASLAGCETAVCLPHLIVSELEHDSIYDVAKHYERNSQATVSYLPPDTSTGAVNVDALVASIRRETVLISLILAQNETGVLQPVAEVSRRLAEVNRSRRERGWLPVLLHTDAAQAIGKVPVSVRELHVDYLTIVGHKFYGPRTGALYIRDLKSGDAAPVYPLLIGGGQERGLRSGTENTPCIVALGAAAQLVTQNLSDYQSQVRRVTQRFESRLLAAFGDRAIFNSHFPDFSSVGGCNCDRHLPNTVNVAIVPPAGCEDVEKYRSGKILAALNGTFHAGAGSACRGGKPSRVLQSCFAPRNAQGEFTETSVSDRVANAIRFSFGRDTTLTDVDTIADALEAYFRPN